jgi:cytochrome c oxidase assembly protein subunit 15
MTSYSEKINKLFYYWLILSFIVIFIMIIVGGLTRLTNSGLSITEWELFSGILPPLNLESWNFYFSLYKKIPQYQLINNNITLEEFKVIFYWEYFHRILGRLIGLLFLIPLVFFNLTGQINKHYLKICNLILLAIIFQGIIGWYMVKSGLVNNVTVSHYRLSMHLTIAFIIIVMIFWLLLGIRNNLYIKFFSSIKKNFIYHFLIIIVFFQIILGAFVSGLDAGKLYQTWPLMNNTYFPNDIIISNVKDFFNFSNHSLVQFYHRNLAYLITAYILFIGFFIIKKKMTDSYKPYCIVFIILLFQIILGIMTLISGLNIYLASGHQICSLLLILSVINLHYRNIN